MDQESKKSLYLKEFERENELKSLGWEKAERVGRDLVSNLKEKELTYEEAYASLQFAYNLLKFESNFLKLD